MYKSQSTSPLLLVHVRQSMWVASVMPLYFSFQNGLGSGAGRAQGIAGIAASITYKYSVAGYQVTWLNPGGIR